MGLHAYPPLKRKNKKNTKSGEEKYESEKDYTEMGMDYKEDEYGMMGSNYEKPGKDFGNPAYKYLKRKK